MYKKLKILAAAVVLCCAPLAASADIISFDFSSTGSGAWTPDGLQLTGTTTTTGLNSYFTSLPSTFSFSALLNQYVGGASGFGMGQQPSGGWSLSDGAGDSLFGSFATILSGGTGAFFYTVTGGTGALSAALGEGGSLVNFAPFPGSYSEGGAFVLAVPEPGVISLLCFGLIAVAWSVRRQRRQLSPATIQAA